MSNENPPIVKILKSKWLGLGLTVIGVLQMVGTFFYLWLFPHQEPKNPFHDLVFIIYAIIALGILVILSLIASLRLFYQHKNEEELGIAVFGILVDVIVIALLLK